MAKSDKDCYRDILWPHANEHFVTKISEFGISNLVSQNENRLYMYTSNPKDLEYIDPESLETGELPPESDVYSFGMVLLRLFNCKNSYRGQRGMLCVLSKEEK